MGNRKKTQGKEETNCGRASFTELRFFFFDEVNWSDMEEIVGVQQKYYFFMNIYERGVRKYVPVHKTREVNVLFNKVCSCKTKDSTYKKRGDPQQKHNRDCRLERNEHVRIRIEEEKKI